VYLARSSVRHARTLAELYGEVPTPEQVQAALGELYPSSLGAALKAWRNLDDEHDMLVALKEGDLSAPGGILRHRGRVSAAARRTWRPPGSSGAAGRSTCAAWSRCSTTPSTATPTC
jgi:hypothetical protein